MADKKRRFVSAVAAALVLLGNVATTKEIEVSAAEMTVIGDLDRDGVVGLNDLIVEAELVSRKLLNVGLNELANEYIELQADVNADGDITVLDVAWIADVYSAQELLGLGKKFFPVESPLPYGEVLTVIGPFCVQTDAPIEGVLCQSGMPIYVGESVIVEEYLGNDWYCLTCRIGKLDAPPCKMWGQLPHDQLDALVQRADGSKAARL